MLGEPKSAGSSLCIYYLQWPPSLVLMLLCSTVSTAEAVCALPLFKHGSVAFFVYSVIKLSNLIFVRCCLSPILVVLTAGTAM